jgi:hypothetical protein
VIGCMLAVVISFSELLMINIQTLDSWCLLAVLTSENEVSSILYITYDEHLHYWTCL